MSAVLIGLAVGFGLCALGVSIFLYELQQAVRCYGPSVIGYYYSCANLATIAGAIIVIAGVATLGGTLVYRLKVWEGEDTESTED